MLTGKQLKLQKISRICKQNTYFNKKRKNSINYFLQGK